MDGTEAPSVQDNGHKDIKTLPVQLGNGPKWGMPADAAARFIQAVYDKSPSLAASCMHLVMTGTELPAASRRRGSAS